MLSRRTLLGMTLAAAWCPPADAASLKSIQKKAGGRLGVHVLDSQSGKRVGIGDEVRFAMASAFKVPLVAALLWQVDRGAFPLAHVLPIDKKDLVANSPVLEPRIAAGTTELTVRELCAATITYSDNTAANVLLAGIGGPAPLTTFI